MRTSDTAGKPKACIIGAGASGLATAKAVADRGIPFECFEKSGRIGGVWTFGNGSSAAYRSLCLNTSRDRSGFRDFPMPRDFPDFPHHSQMASYLEAYVDQFDLRSQICFNTEVISARRLANDRWQVSLSNGENRFYDALVVANGHHWDPRWPNPPYPGQFAGDVLHAHAYRDPTEPVDMRGKKVLVVGLGNSAMDIACELAQRESAAKVLLSGRRGVWVLPKRAFGRPIDQLPGGNMPWRLQSLTLAGVIRATLGVPWHHGLPRPDHRPLAAHPTLSQDLYDHIDRGAIMPKPRITSLGERSVTFDDGTVEDVDVIVYCTGYKVSFPFFDPGFLAAPGNDLPLWRRLVRPGDANLFFVGLFQAIGALMPIVEAQARLIGDCLVGTYVFPSASQMAAEMERERQRLSRRFVRSERHTMEVDFDRYLRELERERRRGRVRAHSVRNTLPVQLAADPPEPTVRSPPSGGAAP